jgi:uncharacterized beta-barrel protein YwiB (DUF1934 family)
MLPAGPGQGVGTVLTTKKEVELTIRSVSESGRVEMRVQGQLFRRDGRWMYHYREPDSELGRVTSTLKVEENLLRLLRQGDIRSEQQFQTGRRLPGFYDTAHGRFELETETIRLHTELPDGTGTLSWAYELYISGESAGRYELDIEVKELPA